MTCLSAWRRRLTRLASGLTVAALAVTLTPSPAAAIAGIDDRLPAFLTSIGDGSVDYWMAFEAAHSRELDALFYRDRSASQKLVLARQALTRAVPVGWLWTFSQRWRADFESVASRVEGLSGRLPQLNVAMWYSMDSRPWVYVDVGGRTTLGLNARFFLPYESTKTRMMFADAFFNSFLLQVPRDMAERVTLSRRVQLEGLKMAVQQRAVPSLPPYRYLGISATTFQAYQRSQKSIARGLIAALDGPESANAMERYFGRGYGDPWPAGAGRYVAYMLAAGIARERNPLELANMPSQDYLFLVRPLLEDMARVDEGLTP